MLHCNLIMKITNEKKGIFAHFIHIIQTKNFSESHFHCDGLNVPLKVLIINKSKHTHHKYAHFR